MGWDGTWGKQLTAGAQVVVHGCTQLSCLCTLPKTCFYWVRLKTQSTIHWHTCVHTNMHAHTHKQTNKLIERGEIASTLPSDSNTIHIANLTLKIFPCVVIILFQFQHPVNRSADKLKKKNTATRTWFSKIKWIFQTCPCFMTFWYKLFSIPLPQGSPGMPGGVGQPGIVGEKVSISH